MIYNCANKMRVLFKKIYALSARTAFLLVCTMACHAIEKQHHVRRKKHKPPLLEALNRCRLLPTDINQIICSYAILPGIFIPFFQKKDSGYDDPHMEHHGERDYDGLEVTIFGIQRGTLLPLIYRCGIFEERDPRDSIHILWDEPQIIKDLHQAFPEFRQEKRKYIGVFKSPWDNPDSHPTCTQVSYNVVRMINFFCRVNVEALHRDTQEVRLGQQASQLYLPPGVSVRDFARSIDTYITRLQDLREKAPSKKFENFENIEHTWGSMLDKTLENYKNIAPAIKEVLADETDLLIPVFWDGGSLEGNVDRVRKKTKTIR